MQGYEGNFLKNQKKKKKIKLIIKGIDYKEE